MVVSSFLIHPAVYTLHYIVQVVNYYNIITEKKKLGQEKFIEYNNYLNNDIKNLVRIFVNFLTACNMFIL